MPVQVSIKASSAVAAMPQRIMRPSEFVTYRRDFHEYFRINGTEPIEHCQRDIPCLDLLQLLTDLNVGSNIIRAVQFHYGLVDTSFVVVFEFLTQDSNGDFAHIGTNEDDWLRFIYDEALRKFVFVPKQILYGLKQAYLSNVQVKRTAGAVTFERLNFNTDIDDPTSTIFPYNNELLSLLQDNGVMASPQDYVLSISCMCAQVKLYPVGNPQDLQNRHCIGLYVGKVKDLSGLNVIIDQLIDGQSALPFTCRAGDLGNLCPPGCPK